LVGDEGGLLLQFRILGPLEVLRGEESLPFRGSRERAVLALLVLHANRTVSAERLAEDLWSGDPPDGAIRSVRVYVSRLRQALGAAGQAVVTRPSGYLLQVDPEAVDALRFEELVARGRDEAKGGDHNAAAVTLREALALWRGPALADVADAPFAQAQASRLEEARLCALEDRIEADLACGRHGQVTAELEALTREQPFRERLWSQRMVALYRSGRQADALRTYQELRSTLREQLGLEPSSALQRLEGAVLRHDPELDWHPGGIAAPPGSVPGLGEENRTDPSVATAEPGRLPQPLRREERLPLVGREVELSRLDQTWQATCSGQRHLVLLAGEPGIGKSRLAAEFARTAHGAGALVLFGRCDEGMGVPYQPFVEALGRYLRQAHDLVLGRLAGELVRLVPEVGERVHGLAPPVRSDPETERYRLFGAVAAWLGATSESVPVVFVIEDLHWATKPTLLLLSHLLRSDEDLRLLVLVTFRDTPLDMTTDLVDLVAELLRLPGVERVRLSGLTEPGVGALMEAQADHKLDDEGWALARVVHGETAGNPFYVREMLRHLAEQGDIVRRDGRWVAGQPLAELDVPDSVRDVIERRLIRLPDRTSEMLALAAVLGERFDLAVLAESSGEPESSVVESLRPAVGARLVEEPDAGQYHFTHALVRSTLEDALGPTRRLQLHRAAGLAVEAVHAGRLDPHLPQLAHHFAQARDVDKAIDYASRAGDRALAQLAHDEAAAYYRQALEHLDPAGRPDDEARRCELLISLGEAQRRAGDAAHRQTLLDAAHLAQQLDDATALARAALTNCRGFFSEAARVDTERISTLESALAACPDPTATRARLLINLAAELGWSPGAPHRQALADEALAIARGLDDPATLGAILSARSSLVEPGRPESKQETAELAALAEQLDDPALAVWANFVQSMNALVLGDGAAHEHFLGRAEHAAFEIGQPLFRWMVGYATVNQSRLAGRLALAEEQANQTMELGLAAGFPDARRIHGANMFGVRYDTGRLAEYADLAGRRRASDPLSSALFALTFAELGRPDEARVFIEDLRPDGFSALPGTFRLYYLTRFAEACACLGDADRAAVLYDLLAPHRGIMASAQADTSGVVDHYLGLLAVTLGRRAAPDHFADAARVHAAFPAPTLLARTRLEWARMLLTRGQSPDAARARDLLGQALGTARDTGLGSIERQAVELLQECR
jgi:DNA-binding SARP family transcriptional activator